MLSLALLLKLVLTLLLLMLFLQLNLLLSRLLLDLALLQSRRCVSPYHSGHGASDGSTNYLIPVDVKTTETGALRDESLRLTEITRKLKAEAGNATHFVVFDACRKTLKLTQPGSRAVVQSNGFVPDRAEAARK